MSSVPGLGDWSGAVEDWGQHMRGECGAPGGSLLVPCSLGAADGSASNTATQESIPDGHALLPSAQCPASSFDVLFAYTSVQHTAWALCVSGLVWSAVAVSCVAGASRTAKSLSAALPVTVELAACLA